MNEKLLEKCGFYCGTCPSCINGHCLGCEDGNAGGCCFTRDCVTEKNLRFCGECKDFPCGMILTKPRATLLDRDWLAWKKRRKA